MNLVTGACAGACACAYAYAYACECAIVCTYATGIECLYCREF